MAMTKVQFQHILERQGWQARVAKGGVTFMTHTAEPRRRWRLDARGATFQKARGDVWDSVGSRSWARLITIDHGLCISVPLTVG